MTGKPAVRVAMAADQNYAIPLAASVRSLLDNSTAPVEVTVLSYKIDTETTRKLRQSWPAEATVDFVDISRLESHLEDLPRRRQVTAPAYARAFLPKLLGDSVERVLYLDVDTVTIGDVAEIWEAELGGRPVGAVRDTLSEMLKGRGVVRSVPEHSALTFNSGVMMMDLRMWRNELIGDQVLTCAQGLRGDLVGDQAALNIVLSGRWTELPAAWNMTVPKYTRMERGMRSGATVEERLRHYVIWKPWRKQYAAMRDSMLFYEYVDRTAWRGWRP